MSEKLKTLLTNRDKASGFHSHARNCKKLLGECKACQAGIEWFKTLPPMDLSDTLRERRGTW